MKRVLDLKIKDVIYLLIWAKTWMFKDMIPTEQTYKAVYFFVLFCWSIHDTPGWHSYVTTIANHMCFSDQ